jgi:cation diffusion facilitator CzcD-associated flavoprotein CzcO
MLDMRWVKNLNLENNTSALRSRDDGIVTKKRVVVAARTRNFYRIPPELDRIAGVLLSHCADHLSLCHLNGKQILVIGGGASGVGIAGSIGGRRTRHGCCASESDCLLRSAAPAQPAEQDVGTGWHALACITALLVFHRMPRDFRHLVVRRHLRPAPGWTSRDEAERNVRVLLGANVFTARIKGNAAEVGARAAVEADHVIAAIGYKVDMRRLQFISDQSR